MNESLPLAKIHDAVLQFLRKRDDAAIFGAQAVNAYVDEPRMTQDVDILSTRGAALAEDLRSHLAEQFRIAVRIRTIGDGQGFRINQLREPKNRHLADVRQVDELPPTQLISEIRVPLPEESIVQKLISMSRRRGQPKADTDRRDVKVLLNAFPDLKTAEGAVSKRLQTLDADESTLREWLDLVSMEIQADDEVW